MSCSKHHFYFQTVVGELLIADKGDCITQISFFRKPDSDSIEMETPVTTEAYRQVVEYLQGKRRQFTLRLSPQGTAFQQQVWKALQTIPYGETRTYGQIAAQIGCPRASRAVGMANHRNPLAIVIPCHRVIGSDGKLTGYAGGLGIKQKLLDIERPK